MQLPPGRHCVTPVRNRESGRRAVCAQRPCLYHTCRLGFASLTSVQDRGASVRWRELVCGPGRVRGAKQTRTSNPRWLRVLLVQCPGQHSLLFSHPAGPRVPPCVQPGLPAGLSTAGPVRGATSTRGPRFRSKCLPPARAAEATRLTFAQGGRAAAS